jgi:hypothetical protein
VTLRGSFCADRSVSDKQVTLECPLPWFQDEMDAGDDPFVPGCHYRYPDSTCNAADKVFFRGDECAAPTPADQDALSDPLGPGPEDQDFVDLLEWTDSTCHQHALPDEVHYGCDTLCGGIGRGHCVVDEDFCGPANDSAHCECF